MGDPHQDSRHTTMLHNRRHARWLSETFPYAAYRPRSKSSAQQWRSELVSRLLLFRKRISGRKVPR